MFKYFAYKLAQFIVSRLPLPLAYRFAQFISDLHYCFSFRDRQAVNNNLRVILNTDEDVTGLTREVFRNFGKYLAEFFRMSRMVDEDFIRNKVKVLNFERIAAVLKKGKGGILTTAHTGNWELGAALVSRLGLKIGVVALPHKERPVNNLFNAQREAFGIMIIPSDVAVRRCMETLGRNEFLALAVDRDFYRNGEVLDFLGKRMLLPKGAAIFSAKTGAPIIPIFLFRQPDHTFVLSIEEPIYPPENISNGTIETEVIVDMINRYKTILEDKIRQHPTQWLMFREFWDK